MLVCIYLTKVCHTAWSCDQWIVKVTAFSYRITECSALWIFSC